MSINEETQACGSEHQLNHKSVQAQKCQCDNEKDSRILGREPERVLSQKEVFTSLQKVARACFVQLNRFNWDRSLCMYLDTRWISMQGRKKSLITAAWFSSWWKCKCHECEHDANQCIFSLFRPIQRTLDVAWGLVGECTAVPDDIRTFFVRDILSFANLTGCNIKLNGKELQMSEKRSKFPWSKVTQVFKMFVKKADETLLFEQGFIHETIRLDACVVQSFILRRGNQQLFACLHELIILGSCSCSSHVHPSEYGVRAQSGVDRGCDDRPRSLWWLQHRTRRQQDGRHGQQNHVRPGHPDLQVSF